MSSKEYTEKWLNDTLSEEEKLTFQRTGEYESLERLSKALMLFKAPDFNEQSEFARLQPKMKEPVGGDTKIISIPWLRPVLRIAAVLVFTAAGYYIFLYNQTVTFTTLAAEKKQLFLPDSSSVTLNACSDLSFQAYGWKRRRLVMLEGEAFFRVKKGSQFDVATDWGSVAVLGTQFNVKTRKDYFEVTCYEGLVEVRSANKVIKVPPARVFRIVKDEITPDKDAKETVPGWVSNESTFESVPFSEVVKEFERQYNTTISIRDFNVDQLFTGRFVHGDLALALKSISIPLNLKYEISNDQKTVVLSGEVN